MCSFTNIECVNAIDTVEKAAVFWRLLGYLLCGTGEKRAPKYELFHELYIDDIPYFDSTNVPGGSFPEISDKLREFLDPEKSKDRRDKHFAQTILRHKIRPFTDIRVDPLTVAEMFKTDKITKTPVDDLREQFAKLSV